MADEVDAPFPDCWTHTHLNTTKIAHKWTISNYSRIPPNDYLESSAFSPTGNDKLKWYLKLYPNSDSTENNDYVGLYIYLMTRKISKVEATANFYFVDVNNKMKNFHSLKHEFLPNVGRGYPRFIEKKVLMEEAKVLLPNDKLTIFCEIDMLENTVNVSGKREPIHTEASTSQIRNNFWSLFKTHDYSDVRLTVGGKDIKAHKMVLAAGSPVFSALLKSDMKETKLSHVVIDDIDHEVFMEMLRYFYTEKVPNLKKMAPKLLAAAEKYNVEGLKAMCAEVLHKSLSIENAVDILALSDLHNVDQLKIAATKFICNHTKEIIDTRALESLVLTFPKLMVETLDAIRMSNNGFQSFTADVEIFMPFQ